MKSPTAIILTTLIASIAAAPVNNAPTSPLSRRNEPQEQQQQQHKRNDPPIGTSWVSPEAHDQAVAEYNQNLACRANPHASGCNPGTPPDLDAYNQQTAAFNNNPEDYYGSQRIDPVTGKTSHGGMQDCKDTEKGVACSA